MKDGFGRTIDYLRISITNACNLKCQYCVPPPGSQPVPSGALLTHEEILEVVLAAVRMGFHKFRLTGGEPSVRPDLITLVKKLSSVSGVDDLCMTTNGQLLAQLAEPLAEAGLDRVNVSLDSMRPDRYREITGGGDLFPVLEGIRKACAVGLTPVKLNCVVERSSSEEDARSVAAFAAKEQLAVRFIRRMNLEKGEFWVVEGGAGGDCPHCNRLRLTSDGLLKPCLFSDISFDVKEWGAEKALRMAIEAKPESGRSCQRHDFCAVGG